MESMASYRGTYFRDIYIQYIGICTDRAFV